MDKPLKVFGKIVNYNKNNNSAERDSIQDKKLKIFNYKRYLRRAVVDLLFLNRKH